MTGVDQSVAFAGLALTAATLTWTTGSWVQARRQERWGAPEAGDPGVRDRDRRHRRDGTDPAAVRRARAPRS